MNLESNSFVSKSGKGLLVLIGGVEDRRDDMLILRKIVEVNNAQTIVIIPTASCYPVGVADDYFLAFKEIGVPNIQVFDIREVAEADLDKYLEIIETTDVVFFTSGDQVKLYSTFKDSKLLQRIIELHNNKQLTIAGTSGGATVASNLLVYDGTMSGLKKGTVKYSKGFGFLSNITVDTHFISRGRLGRLTQFLCTGISQYGIGLDENTSVFIEADNTLTVLGAGMVTMVNTSEVSYNNYNEIQDDEPIVINGIKVGFLQHASRFNLDKWCVIQHEQSAISQILLSK